MSSQPSRATGPEDARRDELALAIERAAHARPIEGNSVQHHAHSPAALDAMLELIAGARRWIHFENYIIRDDQTGRRFGEVLIERARAGVHVCVLYDALGSFGTSRGYWNALRRAGAEVRAFHPVSSPHVFDLFTRDHRKLAVVDGERAMTGGLCIGDEWAGNPARGRQPWRDTALTVCGPAAVALDAAFADAWEQAGPPLPPEDACGDPDICGDFTVQVVAGVPFEGRIYRATQLIAAAARERLWITDAYLVPPAPLYAALIDAAHSGVDVRLLVPGTSDLPLLRNVTRVGYRELLRAGVRVFEWRGAMMHAKTLVADRRWARVGSSNLNVSSLFGNYELDVLADSHTGAETLAAQFRRDLLMSREVVLESRRRLPPRLVRAPATAEAGGHAELETTARHKRSRYELSAVAVVALRRVAGGLRRMLAGSAALFFLTLGVLLLVFPRVAGILIAAVMFWLALGFAVYGFGKRRAREREDVD